ncbi:hypothetical protein BC941DRAFT_375250 [Chlamydoabsidia padenii]|nr:hypothetical protein BC941DRAFT_375250 [Chlamydoabsidia padenii]
MADNNHEAIATFADSTNKNNDTLIPAKGEFQSYSGIPKPFNQTAHFDTIQPHYNSDIRDNHYSTGTLPSPTPVLLSTPYPKNSTFEQRQQQHIHTLPILNGHQPTRIEDYATNETENKKYRSLLLGDTSLEQYPPLKNTTTSSPPVKPKGSGRGRKPAHELLSEEQKKANHIASEQKRRANIRIGFDQLVELVPELTECQRSESLILQKSVDYIRQLVETKNDLRDRVRDLQSALGEIPDEDSSEGELDYGF